MKIGIYARGLSNKLGGVKEVIKLMCETLVHQIGPEDELFIFHNLKSAFFDTPKPRVTEIMLHCGSVFLCDYVLAPEAINRHHLDVVWFPKNVIPFFIKPRTVVTVHDLAYFLPQYRAYRLVDTLYMKIMIRRSCKRADRIVTVSHNTKADVEKILRTSPRKIKVVHLGLDKKYRVIKDRASLQTVREKYNLPDRFILNTGSITPRKNLLRLLQAFNKISATDPDIYLALTGFISYKPKNGSCPSARCGKQRDRRRYAVQKESECLPGDEAHTGSNGQLLRSIFQLGKKPGERLKCRLYDMAFGVVAGDGYCGLAGVHGLSGHAMQ